MNSLRCLLSCAAIILAAELLSPSAQGQVQWISSTAAHPWKTMAAPQLISADDDLPPDIRAEPRRTYQTIDGFGGCFNELGWQALSALPAKDRDQVIQSLFGQDGCAFNMARLPIGASDFALKWYSLDETDGDLALDHFSIDRDRSTLLPYVKAAMRVRPDLQCWGSAWSPPAWMKTNHNYSGGSIRWEPPVLRAYADYLANWVLAYQHEGVNVFAVFTQNEPTALNNYPTCVWTGRQLRDFIADYLGPTLRDRKVNTQLWLGTINDDVVNGRVITVLNDPRANAFISGVSFQYGGRVSIGSVAQLFPDKKLMQSETECNDGNNSWADAQKLYEVMRDYLDHGANSYFMWNMVLNETGKSSWGWKQNAMVTVDRPNHAAKFNGEYFVMRHFSQFIKPGAKRILVTGNWGDKIAFANPDGSVVMVIGNSDTQALPVRLCAAGRSVKDTVAVTLQAASINTFVLHP